MSTDPYALAAEADEARRLAGQRDDLQFTLEALVPVAQAAVNFRALELKGTWVQSESWTGALARLRDAADRYIDQHGTEVEQP